ncbi:MAG TPA: ROK family protein, partial [Acidimicrobiales bacterium]|nr:ROK family protein [Acidimicrobiales bacterium]
AEARFGALVGHDPGIYVNLGTGLAVAIVTGGRVVDGAHGAAGEIAYNLRTIDDLEVPSGERILLEEVVSGRAIAMRATALADRPLTAAEVLTTSGFDDGSNRLLEEFLGELSYHLVNLAVALDPARIVVGGGMVRSWARLEPRLRAALDAGVPFPPELTVARFPFDAPLVGAIALACEVAACESAAPDIVTSAASRIEEAAESGAPSSGRAGVTASRMAGGENRRNGAGDVRGGTPGDFQGELRRNGAAAQTGRHSGNIGTRRGI